MRIAIFGATGRTGRQLVEQALALGHDVTAVARRPEAMVELDRRARVVQADVADSSSVRRAVSHQEAILSALGSPTWRPNTTLSDGIGHILSAMRSEGVRRFVCMSALGVGETRGQLGPLYNLFLIPFMLRHIFADKERLEARLRASDLDWTIVRPGVLTNGPARGQYCQELPGGARPPLFPRISRADVTAFMLREMAECRFLRQAVGLWDC